ELVAGRDLVEPRERDRRVRRDVNGVPPFVPESAARDDDRREDDDDEEDGSDRRGDHPGVDPASEHRADLPGDRDLVELGVAPHGEEDVRQYEVETSVAVPPMPGRQPVEADEALEP